MRAHLRYLRYVLRHKWFVFFAGLKLSVPVHQLIVHDWTKFLPREWAPYVNRFQRGGPEGEEFNKAWLHHLNHNPHHWQDWLLALDDPPREGRYWVEQAHSDLHDSEIAEYQDGNHIGKIETNANINNLPTVQRLLRLLRDANRPDPLVLPMPERFAREMVADWSGAGRALGHGDDVRLWYAKNKNKMILHPETRQYVESLIERLPDK